MIRSVSAGLMPPAGSDWADALTVAEAIRSRAKLTRRNADDRFFILYLTSGFYRPAAWLKLASFQMPG